MPSAAASAVLLPDMPDRNMPTTTLTWARPPRRWPTMAIASLTRRSEIPPSFITLPARKKKGRASSVNPLMPWNICWTTTASGRSAYQIDERRARTRAKEIGTPITARRSGRRTAGPAGPSTARRPDVPGSRGSHRRSAPTMKAPLSGMTMVGMNRVMPSAGDSRWTLSWEKVQPSTRISSAATRIEQINHQPLDAAAAPAQQIRRGNRTEMDAPAHADRGADEDAPDEGEERQLLAPQERRGEGVAQHDLDEDPDRDEGEKRAEQRQKPLLEPREEAVDELHVPYLAWLRISCSTSVIFRLVARPRPGSVLCGAANLARSGITICAPFSFIRSTAWALNSASLLRSCSALRRVRRRA